LLDVAATAIPFARPAGFDLPAFWQEWCAAREAERQAYTVQVRVSPGLLPFLQAILGVVPESAGPPGKDGWRPLTLAFESFSAARTRLMGCGRAVEVVAPEALRLGIADFAEQIVALYGGGLAARNRAD
jgi:hypothetical protein